jgi:murein DD-endopeptidase MepM/ murein hydrolase activator NlpD
MSQKRAISSGKLLYLLSVGLACVVIFDTHRKMVDARTSEGQPSPPVAAQQIETPAPKAKPSPSSSPAAAQPKANQQAVNIGPADASVQQMGEQTAPIETALSDWQGASFPVENFQAYTSPFGYRLSPTGSYSQEFHYGLDMAAPEGSYVRNWWSGTVVEVSDNSNCGTSVVVESGTWTHIYCHMQGHVETNARGKFLIDREGGLQIWEGQTVRAGERIGRVGMTGRTTGPHLHWGLKYDSNWVDPALVLRAMYSGQRNAAAPTQTPVQ